MVLGFYGWEYVGLMVDVLYLLKHVSGTVELLTPAEHPPLNSELKLV